MLLAVQSPTPYESDLILGQLAAGDVAIQNVI